VEEVPADDEDRAKLPAGAPSRLVHRQAEREHVVVAGEEEHRLAAASLRRTPPSSRRTSPPPPGGLEDHPRCRPRIIAAADDTRALSAEP
jgi:hypothetical protein